MRSPRLFWIVFTALTALAVHLAYILFVPHNQLSTALAAIAGEEGMNRLVIVDGQPASFNMAAYDKELAYAVCPFDLSSGLVTIRAQVPFQYWSLEVYGARGQTLYTLNDQQAPRRQLEIVLHDDDPDPQAIVSAANSANRSLDSISVLTGGTNGVAILRSAAAGALERRRALDAFAMSSCAVQQNN
jgi:uncharacterized membrane protein